MSEQSKNQGLSDRKEDHLNLTDRSQLSAKLINQYFDYEPLLTGFPEEDRELSSVTIAGKKMKAPIWISSMTGGTGKARHVNQNLAKVCREFGLGMGLGSCRPLLDSDEYFNDFALRSVLGDDCPFFANIGIAQVDQLLSSNKFSKFINCCQRLEVDGFFIHLNPLQEWHQAEGDRWYRSPIEMINEVMEQISSTGLKLGVKEVGQGMGPRSLEVLLKLPLACLEFAAFGGTNFSYLEQLRGDSERCENDDQLCFVGHNIHEMLACTNRLMSSKPSEVRLETLIISGGVRSYLEGHYFTELSNIPAVYGMASPFLTMARLGEEQTRNFVREQIEGLKMAKQFLHIKSGNHS